MLKIDITMYKRIHLKFPFYYYFLLKSLIPVSTNTVLGIYLYQN